MSTHTPPTAEDGKGRGASGLSPLPRAIGTPVVYCCMNGFLNPAKIVAARADGKVDIELDVRPALLLTRIDWHDGPIGTLERMACMADDGAIAYGHRGNKRRATR